MTHNKSPIFRQNPSYPTEVWDYRKLSPADVNLSGRFNLTVIISDQKCKRNRGRMDMLSMWVLHPELSAHHTTLMSQTTSSVSWTPLSSTTTQHIARYCLHITASENFVCHLSLVSCDDWSTLSYRQLISYFIGFFYPSPPWFSQTTPPSVSEVWMVSGTLGGLREYWISKLLVSVGQAWLYLSQTIYNAN